MNMDIKQLLKKNLRDILFNGELNTLLYELANFMVACGFSHESIEEKILYSL